LRALSPLLLAAGGIGVVATFWLAAVGDMGGATRAAGATCAAVVLGIILRR
jgi:hypothetical protein